MSLGTTTISELQTDYLEATTRESGPNDSKRVVWASGEFFIIIRVFFSLQIIFIGTTSILELQTDYLEATTRESGPNDPRREECTGGLETPSRVRFFFLFLKPY